MTTTDDKDDEPDTLSRQRRDAKNRSSRARAAVKREKMEAIKAKPPESLTPEERQELESFEDRRQRKNNRSRERALEKKAEMERILALSERKRTKQEQQFVDEFLMKKKKKNEGDRMRRLRMKGQKGLPNSALDPSTGRMIKDDVTKTGGLPFPLKKPFEPPQLPPMYFNNPYHPWPPPGSIPPHLYMPPYYPYPALPPGMLNNNNHELPHHQQSSLVGAKPQEARDGAATEKSKGAGEKSKDAPQLAQEEEEPGEKILPNGIVTKPADESKEKKETKQDNGEKDPAKEDKNNVSGDESEGLVVSV